MRRRNVFKCLLSILLVLTMLFPNFIFPFFAAGEDVEETAVNSENIILNKKTVPTNDPEIFRIDLETYAKGALVTNVKSADIVLILDISGSMNNAYSDYARVESETYLKTSLNYYIIQNGKYVKIDHYSERKVSGKVVREEGWYVYVSNSASIVTADKLTFKVGGTGENNEYTFYSTEKIDALKHSATLFIDKLHTFTEEYDVDFRLAAVTFSSDSKVITGNKKDDVGAYVSVKNNVQSLKDAIWSLVASGDTYPGKGTADALNIIKSGYVEDKQLFTVFFGDGAASSTSATTGSRGAVEDAYEMKNTYNAEVYSIGIFDNLPPETSDVYYLLSGISSNYPYATRATKNYLGAKVSSEYYIPATDFTGLDSAFDKITNAVGTPYEDLVVKDIVTQYFYLSDAQKQAISEAYPGQIDFVDHEDGTTEIKITGMDFPIVLCDDDGNPLDPNDPGIFRFSFHITLKEEFAGGNQVPTNTSDSGIYTVDDNEILEYPVPDVDIPIKYDMDAHDYSIYIGDTVKQSDIYTNDDGKWMADMVHIEYDVKDSKGNSFTDVTTLTDNETYTITATITPLHEGDFEAVTFTKKATVNVFKPTVNFTKDFSIFKGEKADIENNYTVSWTCPENPDAKMPSGEAPNVTLELKDKTGVIADAKAYGPVTADKTPVNHGINAFNVKSAGVVLSSSDYSIVSVKNTPVSGSNFTVTVKPNLITYDLNGGKMESNPDQYTYGVGVSSFKPATKTGYDFLYWQDTKTGDSLASISKTAKGDYNLKAVYAARVDTKYVVNHYTENLDGSWKLELKEDLKGETDTTATAKAKTFDGFTYNSSKSTATGTIKADGTLVLNLYYTRNEYDLNITYQMSDGTTAPAKYDAKLYFGEDYAVNSPSVPGYTADKKVVSGTMPNKAVNEIVTYSPNADTKYTVKHFTEKLDGGWKLEETENCTGTTNTVVDATVNTYVGFRFDENLGKLTGTVAGDGSLVLEVYYRRNSHNLKVDYVMSDATTAPDDYSAALKFDEEYSVTSPVVPGYTPDKGTVKGTMPDKDVIEKVVYTPNQDTPYMVKHYTEKSDGTWKLEETEYLAGATNATAEVDPNSYNGFTLDRNKGKLSGKILADGSLVLEAYYTRNNYNLTVEYEMSDGSQAPAKHSEKVEYQSDYSVTTPVVPGYTPDKTVVAGTMPADNVTVKVTYTPNSDTKYTVLHYTENFNGTWTLKAKEDLTGTTNTTANVTPKTFDGFTFNPALGTLSGVISADGSLVLTAYYTRNSYNLNVKYEMSDETQAPDEYRDRLEYEKEYSVTSPDILGYTPDKSVVEGKMPADDVVEVVVYTPNSDTKYKVLHYTKNLDGTWTLEETEYLEGVTNTIANVVPKDFTGFTFDENLGILSGLIKPDNSLVLEAYYIRNVYNVNVSYTMSDGTQAPEQYVTILQFGDNYSVNSPDILGYTPDRLLVSGTVPDHDVFEQVIYSPNSNTPYKVLHFTQTRDGGWQLVETENLIGVTNSIANADPNVYTGFTFDDSLGILSGVIAADGSLELEVYYIRNSHDMIIEYIMSDGTAPPDKYTATLKYEDDYSVTSPEVLGYIADRTVVSGVMPDGNVYETVIYTPRDDTPYKVLHYIENLDGTWTLADTIDLVGVTNTIATAQPNEYTGFTFDETLGTLSGIIAADGSLVLEVYYTRNSYNLTIEYVMSDGTLAPEAHISTHKHGEDYSVISPAVLGYTADILSVDGTMPTDDVNVVVTYAPNNDTRYTVHHFTQNLDGTWNYELSEVLTGTTNTTVTAVPKEFLGFEFDETLGTLSGVVAADGSLVLEVYYTKILYTITYVADDRVHHVAEYEYGATILPILSPGKLGYKFVGWDNLPETMPAQNITVTAIFEKIPEHQVTINPDNTKPNVGTPDKPGSSNSTPSGSHSSVPKTGVELNFAAYITVFVFAMLMMVVLLKKRPENS